MSKHFNMTQFPGELVHVILPTVCCFKIMLLAVLDCLVMGAQVMNIPFQS